MKNRIKKSIYFLLAAMLMMTLVACGNAGNNNNENNVNNEANNEDDNLSLGDLANLVEELDELEENQEAIEEQKEEAGKNLSNVADFDGVIYTVLSSEVVEGVYEPDAGYEAVKIDLLVENTTSEMRSVNSMMGCTFKGESGEEYYEDMFAGGDIKGDLVNPIGPGKILRGEILIFSQATDENFNMAVEDFFSGSYAELTFKKGEVYNDAVPVSAADGKGFGDEIAWHELLTFTVNSAEVTNEEDRSYITLKVTAKNLTSEPVDEYAIPFVLIDENGYDCDMDYMQDNYVVADVEGGEEREIELIFKLEDPEVKEFDLYLQPFAEEALDVVHITVE